MRISSSTEEHTPHQYLSAFDVSQTSLDEFSLSIENTPVTFDESRPVGVRLLQTSINDTLSNFVEDVPALEKIEPLFDENA